MKNGHYQIVCSFELICTSMEQRSKKYGSTAAEFAKMRSVKRKDGQVFYNMITSQPSHH